MQNKKMTNPTDGINESNKKLRAIYDQLCCITTAISPSTTYNEMSSVSIAAAGTQVFAPGTVHSFAWELGTGATIQISNGVTTNTFETNGNVTFSNTNTQTITVTAVGGTVKLIYLY
jgi:uncharacterized protein with WD repeat